MITIILIIITATILVDLFINYWVLKKCPKCNASLFDISRIDKKVVGSDIEDSYIRIERKTYICRSCKYKWSIRKNYDEKSKGD